jgi:hypothetical protein
VGYRALSKKPQENIAGLLLKLGEPLESDLIDFSAANYQASKTEIIREALNEHIQSRLAEPEMRARFEKARQKRVGI